jgi:hypothetical protein
VRGQLARLLGDRRGVVAHPLELVGHVVEREQEAQVAGHRLLGGDGGGDQRGDVALGLVDPAVADDRAVAASASWSTRASLAALICAATRLPMRSTSSLICASRGRASRGWRSSRAARAFGGRLASRSTMSSGLDRGEVAAGGTPPAWSAPLRRGGLALVIHRASSYPKRPET